jgi:hypothetical protein
MKDKHDRQHHQSDTASDSERHVASGAARESRGKEPNTPNATSAGHGDKDETKERQFRKRITILSIVFSGLLLVATTVYAWFAGGQWQAMDASLKEIRQNRELEYRAYIGAKGAVFQQRPDNAAWGFVVLTSVNTGRTQPKGGAYIKREVRWLNEPPKDDAAVSDVSAGSKLPYMPNIEYNTIMGQIPSHVADILAENAKATSPSAGPVKQPGPTPSPTPTVIASLIPTEAPQFGPGWYLWGYIKYFDIFDKEHTTKFCFYNRPGTTGFAICPSFNDSN